MTIPIDSQSDDFYCRAVIDSERYFELQNKTPAMPEYSEDFIVNRVYNVTKAPLTMKNNMPKALKIPKKIKVTEILKNQK